MCLAGSIDYEIIDYNGGSFFRIIKLASTESAREGSGLMLSSNAFTKLSGSLYLGNSGHAIYDLNFIFKCLVGIQQNLVIIFIVI